jgi:hypothetical protein
LAAMERIKSQVFYWHEYFSEGKCKKKKFNFVNFAKFSDFF